MPVGTYTYDLAATMWRSQANGLPDLPPPSPGNVRDGLIYGTYIPADGVTCGLRDPGALTELNDPSTNTFTLSDGGVYRNKIIYGDLRLPSVHASLITIDNCLLRGGAHIPSINDAVVRADQNRSGTGMLSIIDSEVSPQLPALNRDGIRGHRIDVRRTYVHNTIDGITFYATPSQNSGQAKCKAFGNLVEDLVYFYPDYDNGISGGAEHADGTHNDALVLTGGKDMHVKGNYFRGTGWLGPGSGNSPSHPGLLGQGFNHGNVAIITNTVGNPSDLTVIVEENWFYGGNCHINIKPNLTATVRNNRHYRAVCVESGRHVGYWLRYDQRAGNGVHITTDTWVDGPYAGQVLTEPRDRGIDFIT